VEGGAEREEEIVRRGLTWHPKLTNHCRKLTNLKEAEQQDPNDDRLKAKRAADAQYSKDYRKYVRQSFLFCIGD
jgi:hypothetical protein